MDICMMWLGLEEDVVLSKGKSSEALIGVRVWCISMWLEGRGRSGNGVW